MSADEVSEEFEVTPGEAQELQLRELLEGLVGSKGRVGAAEALGVNYRTLSGSIRSGRLSSRMRRALEEYVGTEVVASSPRAEVEEQAEALERRVQELEEEVRAHREMVATQAGQLEEFESRLSHWEQEQGQRHDQVKSIIADSSPVEWKPPSRAYGLPDAGVVTLDPQPDESHAFGPAADLVAEWRSLRTGGNEASNKLERARAEERRWELEIAMIEEFGLTLPPETEPLHESRRDSHLGWRRKTLERVRQERSSRERLRVLRRVFTLGLWWR